MKHNYLLLIPSLMRDGCRDITYTTSDGRSYLGSQTNIAATQHIMDRLHDRGEQLDRILMVCSDEVLEKPIQPAGAEMAVTSLAYYEKAVSDFAKNLGYSEEKLAELFRPFSQAQINPGDCNAMEEIQQKMSQEIQQNSESGLYLDFTGGQRDASMLLVFFARLLEHCGARVQDVLYSKIDQGGKAGHIESCMDTYRLFYRLDDITSSHYGDLTHLEKSAREMGYNSLADEISQTQEAVQKKKAGNYVDAAKKAKKLEPAVQSGSVMQQAMAKAVDSQREKLTVENTLKEEAATGNLKNASQIIRESVIRMLVDKGLVRCPRWMVNDGKELNQNFSLYARYYGTYLKFVETMLRQLQPCANQDQLWDQYDAYMEEHTHLTPSSRKCVTISEHLLQEFSQENPEFMDMLNKKLMDRVMQSEITMESLVKAFSEYEKERNAYLTTYLTAGFPFGNIDNTRSRSYFYIYRSNWENGRRSEERIHTTYANEYEDLLDRTMNDLLKKPMDEIHVLLEEALKNPDQLPQLFPPLCVSTLFSPADRDNRTFGQLVHHIDQTRKQRNIMVHDGEKVSNAFIKKADSGMTAILQALMPR